MKLFSLGIVKKGYLTKSPPLHCKTPKRWHLRFFILYDAQQIQEEIDLQRRLSNQRSQSDKKAKKEKQNGKRRRSSIAENVLFKKFRSKNTDGDSSEEDDSDCPVLIYYENEEKEMKGSQPLNKIYLDGATVCNNPNKVNGYKFVIDLTTKDRIFHLCAENEEDHLSWLAVLKEHLEDDIHGLNRADSIDFLEDKKADPRENNLLAKDNRMIVQLNTWRQEREMGNRTLARDIFNDHTIETPPNSNMFRDGGSKKDSGIESGQSYNDETNEHLPKEMQNIGIAPNKHSVAINTKQYANVTRGDTNNQEDNKDRYSYVNVDRLTPLSAVPDGVVYYQNVNKHNVPYGDSHAFWGSNLNSDYQDDEIYSVPRPHPQNTQDEDEIYVYPKQSQDENTNQENQESQFEQVKLQTPPVPPPVPSHPKQYNAISNNNQTDCLKLEILSINNLSNDNKHENNITTENDSSMYLTRSTDLQGEYCYLDQMSNKLTDDGFEDDAPAIPPKETSSQDRAIYYQSMTNYQQQEGELPVPPVVPPVKTGDSYNNSNNNMSSENVLWIPSLVSPTKIFRKPGGSLYKR